MLPYTELFRVVYNMGARAVQKVVDPALKFSEKIAPYTLISKLQWIIFVSMRVVELLWMVFRKVCL